MKLISFNRERRLLITSPAELNNRSDGTLVHCTSTDKYTRAVCANTGKISTCSFQYINGSVSFDMGFFLKYADISVGASTEVSGFLTPLLAAV